MTKDLKIREVGLVSGGDCICYCDDKKGKEIINVGVATSLTECASVCVTMEMIMFGCRWISPLRPDTPPLPKKGPRGPRGPKGSPGPMGPKGSSGSFSSY